jgi:hypothetical protein
LALVAGRRRTTQGNPGRRRRRRHSCARPDAHEQGGAGARSQIARLDEESRSTEGNSLAIISMSIVEIAIWALIAVAVLAVVVIIWRGEGLPKVER